MQNNRKTVSQRIRFRILRRDNFRCQYCGRNADEVILEVDHIIPVIKSGGNEEGNLITSCRECNRGKRAQEIIPNENIRQATLEEGTAFGVQKGLSKDNPRTGILIPELNFYFKQENLVNALKSLRGEMKEKIKNIIQNDGKSSEIKRWGHVLNWIDDFTTRGIFEGIIQNKWRSQIIRHIGRNEATIRNRIKQLKKANIIQEYEVPYNEKQTCKKYKLTERGEAIVKVLQV